MALVSLTLRVQCSGSVMSMAGSPPASAAGPGHQQPSVAATAAEPPAGAASCGLVRDGRDGAKAGRRSVNSAVPTGAGCGNPHPAHTTGVRNLLSQEPVAPEAPWQEVGALERRIRCTRPTTGTALGGSRMTERILTKSWAMEVHDARRPHERQCKRAPRV